ncbi:MAG: metal-dependent hydrolase [Planctomycetota bacterium]
MADFRTHITTSTVLGFGYGAAGHFLFGLPIPACFVAGGLCSVAGMLPDLDSNSGIPQREMLSFVSVIVPVLMWDRFEALGLTDEHIVFVAAVMYVFIRFVIGGIFRRYTKHRGMWHSIPAALIAGLVTFLLCLCPDLGVRLFKAWAVVLGFVCHLILDEIYAVDWQGRTIRVKRSFGTALKMFGSSKLANFTTYGKLVLLGVLIASDGMVMEYFGCEPVDIPWSARDWFRDQINGGGSDTILR